MTERRISHVAHRPLPKIGDDVTALCGEQWTLEKMMPSGTPVCADCVNALATISWFTLTVVSSS